MGRSVLRPYMFYDERRQAINVAEKNAGKDAGATNYGRTARMKSAKRP
jgi:hypothetical protein